MDIGATRDGLVHISCLKGFVEKIEEVELGQEVMVWVKSTKNGRLSLTMEDGR